VNAYAEVFRKDLFEYNIVHETTMDGKRRLRRYFPELDAEGVQDLPPENPLATPSRWPLAQVRPG